MCPNQQIAEIGYYCKSAKPEQPPAKPENPLKKYFEEKMAALEGRLATMQLGMDACLKEMNEHVV